MSIIHDALKKVEGTLGQRAVSSGAPPAAAGSLPVHRKAIAILLLVVAAGFLVGSLALSSGVLPMLVQKAFRMAPLPRSAAMTPAQKQAQANSSPFARTRAPSAREPFVLNGIAATNEESYALINNEIVSVGDMVGDAMVVKIVPEEVVLESKGELISLRTKR